MIKILFICHGNICRSPMAEFVMKDMIKKRGLEDVIFVASAATSTEEIGNSVHYGTRSKLREVGIDTAGKRAIQVKAKDYLEYDYLVCMDQRNMTNLKRIISSYDINKVFRLLDITELKRDIADPWYTGNFDETYEDVVEGCSKLLDKLLDTM